MNWPRVGVMTLGGVLGILASLLVLAWAEHTPSLAWMSRYTSAGGVGCCSERDCVQAPVAVIQFGEQETTVVIHGTVLVIPAKSVHQSEDEKSWWCSKGAPGSPPTTDNTRCAFFTVGS